ncbi:MAG: ABC transporter transmembrane domain-containing protein [Thermoleophilia bacterium]
MSTRGHGPSSHLAARPEDDMERMEQRPTRKLRKLIPMFAPYKWRALTTILLMLVVTATGLAGPALAQVAIDHGIGDSNSGVLVLTVVLFVAAGLIGVVAGYWQTYLSAWVGERVLLDLRTRVFNHMMRLELGYHERVPTGRSVSRLTSDIEALEGLVSDGFTSLVVNGLTFVGVVVILFAYDWQLALLAFTVFPLLAAGTAVFRVTSARAYRRTRERVAEVLSVLQETLSGMRVVQGFGRQDHARSTFREANDAYREANMATIRLSGVYFPGIELLSGVGLAVILWFGSNRVLDGDLSIGVMVAFIGYMSSFFDPIQQLSQLYSTFQSAMAALEKILGVLETEPELADTPDAVALPSIRGEVELEGVSFGYRPDRPVLHDLSLTIPAGTTAALVGSTGAGKSTLAKLIARFYDPQDGVVRIDGTDLRAVTQAVAALPARHRAAGGSSVRGHPAREPRVRRAARDRRGTAVRPPGRRRRRHARRAPRRPRLDRERTRRGALGRPAPARVVRPGPGRPTAPAHPGRGDVLGRRSDRGPDRARHAGHPARAHRGADRPSPVHDPAGRHDRGPRSRPDPRTRLARRAHGTRRPLRLAVRRLGGRHRRGHRAHRAARLTRHCPWRWSGRGDRLPTPAGRPPPRAVDGPPAAAFNA